MASDVLSIEETTRPRLAQRQPGLIIAREMSHIEEDDLVRVALFLLRRVSSRLRVASVTYRNGDRRDVLRAFSDKRAEPVVRAVIRRLRARGGTL